MKTYEKPMMEETLISTNDILFASGLQISKENANFNLTDEVL